jgi:hypothetical protein
MAKRVSMKHKRREAPEWLFPWGGLRASSFPKVFAILLAGGAFAVLLTSVRIRVAAPVPWAAPKAAVIQVLDDAEGRTLTLRAREGGPFPSRFEPAGWELASAIEQAAYQAARWRPPPYVPTLRELPEESALPRLAKPGAPVLPVRQPPAEPVLVAGKRMLVPVLHPLSGITAAEMPRELPPFDGEVPPAMAAAPWRFLLRVDAAGGVFDCVSLTGGDEPGKAALAAWLRRVSFKPAPAGATRWIALGLGFSNQSADGTDAR